MHCSALLSISDPKFSVYSAFVRSMLPLLETPRKMSITIGLRDCRKSCCSLHCNHSQCSWLQTCSLRDFRAIAGLLFLNDLLVGNIYCPCLLGCINFNVPAKNLRTMVPFLDRAVRTN